MLYNSTSGAQQAVRFRQAVFQNLPDDGGLCVPAEIPVLPNSFLQSIQSLSDIELMVHLLRPFVHEDISSDQLNSIIQQTLSFDIPLVQIGTSDIYSLELFHGPTWAFKDIGARFIAGCLSLWTSEDDKPTILVATSGDTGGAVAAGFQHTNVNVVILYPQGKISAVQEAQIAGIGSNVKAYAVEGSFDDCQQLVKLAFQDKEITAQMHLTSANSINIARWLPQMIFYAIAWREIIRKNLPRTIAVPSGNYGNIASGLLAHCMGLHFENIIAAHNANDTIPRWLKTKQYLPNRTIPTLANAMDVSDPNNFSRFLFLLKKQTTLSWNAISVSDKEIIQAIRTCWHDHQYLLDPHAATAWHIIKSTTQQGVLFATAHPQKFEETIIRALGHFPSSYQKVWPTMSFERKTIKNKYADFKKCLLEKNC